MQRVNTTSRTECYAATRPQQGRTQNEDAFLIGRGDRPFAALCDGAGNAERAGKRALILFEKLVGEATPELIASEEIWAKWAKVLDSSLLGAAQSTFLGLAFTAQCCGHVRWRFTGISRQSRRPSTNSHRRCGEAPTWEWPISAFPDSSYAERGRRPAPAKRWSLDTADPVHLAEGCHVGRHQAPFRGSCGYPRRRWSDRQSGRHDRGRRQTGAVRFRLEAGRQRARCGRRNELPGQPAR